MLQFDLREGFPAVTSKKLFMKPLVGELCGFFRGAQSASEFRDLGCGIWDQNANETPSWIANPKRKGADDLGRIYGAQWTDWKDWREVRTDAEFERLISLGYELVASDISLGVRVMRRGMNQIEDALRQVITNPTNRRIIVNAWRPDEFDAQALPPCHVMYQFLVNVERKELHLCMYQRSVDLLLGAPFNIASSALFLSIMARLSGLTAATFSHFMADAHIYVNHVDQIKEQLTRSHFPAPRLVLSDSIRKVGVDEIAGVLKRIEPSDISLEGYQSHAAIRAPMAA